MDHVSAHTRGDQAYLASALNELGDDALNNIFANLARLHSKTKGLLKPHKTYDGFSKDVAARLVQVSDDISADEKDRVERTLESVVNIEKSMTVAQMVYVHGDYHPGNILLDQRGEITGLIDTDWGRIGQYMEDLAYTAMMFLRNYKTQFFFDNDRLERLLTPYGFDQKDRSKLNDYLILYTFYDVYVFKTMQNIPEQQKYFDYQKSMLKELCAKL